MELLLDTHIWVWSQDQAEKLSPRVAQEIRSAKNKLWISPISIWEIQMLEEKGKLRIREGVSNWIGRALQALPMQEAPVTFQVAQQVRNLGLSHRDPADRLIAATASVFDLTLVTADERLMRSRSWKVLPNR